MIRWVLQKYDDYGNFQNYYGKKKNFSKNCTIKLKTDIPELNRFQNMLPHLNDNLNDSPSSLREIFNARQLYISDIRITQEFIRYIRPINDKEEQKYKKRYSENIKSKKNRL